MGIWLRVERTEWSVSGVVDAWVTLYIYVDSLLLGNTTELVHEEVWTLCFFCGRLSPSKNRCQHPYTQTDEGPDEFLRVVAVGVGKIE